MCANVLVIVKRPLMALGIRDCVNGSPFVKNVNSIVFAEKGESMQIDEHHLIVLSNELCESKNVNVSALKARLPDIPILLLKNDGINGYLDNKIWVFNNEQSDGDFISLVHEILVKKDAMHKRNREYILSTYEQQILAMICDEMSSAQIADVLCRSKRTIEGTRRQIMKKMGVTTPLGMVKRAYQLGLLSFTLH